ncbi:MULTISPECIES: beta-ketoacyl-ACP synthase II [Muribaculaceae]|jgi:3-oxoacyl-[acyl-carrier-protein] synthase II|uniref:3-oxoacyl-[acyl-carrier-protein] synthase 2 n=15 Tax=Bacteria TaxID=2 RepID=A0A2V1IMS5_9BACT|nr:MULTISPECIES: beta-ketoacyl-ACP synthase II [Muribaculaceae]NBH91393.1 beta-ketoacyl-[acyl-carrier-protein] synthase II [Muribaculaceae bacterium S4]NBI19716.1 beta-ketoacyl-[acyl-carrier-protein] synthase II [Muribaculaceae bacterium Z1]ROS90139.1 beta-ketoacyl-[acyl-carrier-protein] synthase II [Muribaculaceae bacterium Isolate-039 (Harlan)]ROS99456.1 beta-ketoacyl-[acyl-carrier-protein] synthase II [Muribaculaceae bacterium Isolate-077 (Janvier)]ROS99744.1 beta-ketoacyl-[acyl-carrier-pro
MELKRVVVTGLGAITPIGNDVETTWLNAVAGKSGAAPITHFDASQFKTQFACEVKDFNPNDHFDRKKLRQLDLYAQYAMVAARQAVADSGIEEAANLDRNRVGVIVAAGIGGLHTFEEEAGYYALNGPQQGPKYNPFFIPKMIADIASGHISMEYNYHGPNFGVVSACASSNNAIIDAFNLIRLGKADVFVTGGAEAAIYPAGVGGFNSMHALSTRNDDPEHASRPFSASRDGFVMGEGSVVLILEELEHAKARGAKIYAEVAGGGMSADAYHLTATHPEGLGAILSMRNALEDAGMKPEDIDYINVHGTSTPVGDISEVKAIVEVFGEQAHKLNISSTKSMTGHLLGATGALEAMFSVLSVKNDIVPPTINHEEGDNDENIDYTLNFTFNKAENRPVRAALSNSFGFGGHNATVIVKKYEE